MSERALRLAVAALALAGAGIAAYLSYTRLTDTSIICPTSGCATVQRSAYGELAGVPVAYLGVLAYGAVFATTASTRTRAAYLGAELALAVLGFSLYLLAAQLLSIHAVCVWCVASDAVAFVLVLVALARLRRQVGPGLLSSGRSRSAARR